MREPGGLTSLGKAGRAAWAKRVRQAFAEAATESPNEAFLPSPTRRTTQATAPDWTGLPVRVTACLGRERGLRLLDRRSDRVEGGGRRWQEDYVEWRARRKRGRIDRVELTTELAEYWTVLAAHAPAELLDTVASFAGEQEAERELVFGDCDPFGDGVSPDDRADAFARTMLRPRGRSPYNNGERAITCMTQRTNTLYGVIALALAAASCRVVRDGEDLRCLTCTEAIPLIGNATLGRASDPVLVERLGRLAYEGRLVAFDDPIGISLEGVEHERLRTPHGEVVPAEWFRFSRGNQRLTFEVPPEERYTVGELVDVATEQPLRYGGEVADLVRLVMLFRVSEADMVEVDRESPVESGISDRDDGCAEIRRAARA